MKTLTLLVVALLAFAGCNKKETGADSAAAAMQKMEELKTKMCACKDPACAQAVSDEFSKWSQEQAKNQKEPPKPTNEQQKRAAEIGEEMGKCLQTAMGAAAYPPPENLAAGSAEEGSAGAMGSAGSAGSAAPAAGIEGLPPECAEYRATVEKLKTCDKIPANARDALTKAFNDAAAGWVNMPEGAKAGLSTSCKAGTQAVVDAAKEACGW